MLCCGGQWSGSVSQVSLAGRCASVSELCLPEIPRGVEAESRMWSGVLESCWVALPISNHVVLRQVYEWCVG